MPIDVGPGKKRGGMWGNIAGRVGGAMNSMNKPPMGMSPGMGGPPMGGPNMSRPGGGRFGNMARQLGGMVGGPNPMMGGGPPMGMMPPMGPPPPMAPMPPMPMGNQPPMVGLMTGGLESMPPPMPIDTAPMGGMGGFLPGGFNPPGGNMAPPDYSDPNAASMPNMGGGMNPQMGGLRKAFGGNPPPQRFGNGRF